MHSSAQTPQNLRASDLRLDELQQRINATDDLVAEHETRIDLTYRGLETVTLQIQELSTAFDHLRRDVPTMVAEGLVKAARDPKLWESMRAGMREGAERAAGGWVLKLVRVGLDRAFWAALFGFALLKVAGPGALIEWLTKGH